jgi:hypothetical protein
MVLVHIEALHEHTECEAVLHEDRGAVQCAAH